MRVSWEYIYTPVYISPSICISVLPPGLADRLSCRHRIVWRSDLIKKISGCYRISVLRPSSDRNRHYYRDLHFFVCISFIVSASKLQAIRFDSIKTGVYIYGYRDFRPLSDRNRFLFRPPTLPCMYSKSDVLLGSTMTYDTGVPVLSVSPFVYRIGIERSDPIRSDKYRVVIGGRLFLRPYRI